MHLIPNITFDGDMFIIFSLREKLDLIAFEGRVGLGFEYRWRHKQCILCIFPTFPFLTAQRRPYK